MRLVQLLLWVLPAGIVALVLWRGTCLDPAFVQPPDKAAAPSGLRFPETLGAWRAAAHEWFPRERIYEKIDGRDVLFMQYDVQSLQCATWDGAGAWDMYLYTMREPAGARGVWLAEKPATAQLTHDGTVWFTPGAAAVHHGQFYLAISAAQADASITDATNLLALLRAYLPAAATAARDPAALLPRDGMSENSLEFIPNDAFGFETLDNIHAAGYRVADDDAVWFVTVASNSTAAAALVSQYADEFACFGGSQTFAHAHGFSGVMFDAWETIIYTNDIVFGVRDANSLDTLTQHWQHLLLHIHRALRDEH